MTDPGPRQSFFKWLFLGSRHARARRASQRERSRENMAQFREGMSARKRIKQMRKDGTLH